MTFKTKTLEQASMMIYKDGVDTTEEENRALVKLVEKLIFNTFANHDEDNYNEDYDYETGKEYLTKLLRK